MPTGNAFGEDGIELLRESLEAKGLIDHLGSLSDDEELDSEEEEEEEEEEGAEKEEEEGGKVEEGSENGGGGGGEKDNTIEGEEEVKADISSTEEQRDTVPVSKMDDESSKIEQNTVRVTGTIQHIYIYIYEHLNGCNKKFLICS